MACTHGQPRRRRRYVVGKPLETTEAELIATVFPHPTLSETVHETILAAYGRVIHT